MAIYEVKVYDPVFETMVYNARFENKASMAVFVAGIVRYGYEARCHEVRETHNSASEALADFRASAVAWDDAADEG